MSEIEDLIKNCKIIRSNRKTICMKMNLEGLTINVPFRVVDEEIAVYLSMHKKWIEKNWEKLKEQSRQRETVEPLSAEEIQALADQALKIIPQRVAYYAPLVGVTYGRITIRNQRTRWGSCSSKGNLNFNCLLMLTPPEVIDSVVVHELCHRKEMNHSRKFYAEIMRVFPEYPKWDKWLKENGKQIMMRMTN